VSADQIHGERRHTFEMLLGKTELDRDILAVDKPRFGQAFAERGGEMRNCRRSIGAEEPDHRHRVLLRARRERPHGRHAAEKGDELASSF
jgi:hypothetical protein